jgi:hypothetical protein
MKLILVAVPHKYMHPADRVVRMMKGSLGQRIVPDIENVLMPLRTGERKRDDLPREFMNNVRDRHDLIEDWLRKMYCY